MIPKCRGAEKCEKHRKISLLSQAFKNRTCRSSEKMFKTLEEIGIKFKERIEIQKLYGNRTTTINTAEKKRANIKKGVR